ncbi:hypothetical protein ABZP36_005054 [Zizania latifolia]
MTNEGTTGVSLIGGGAIPIVVWNGTRVHWRRAAWIGSSIAGVIQTNTSFKIYQTVNNDAGDGYYFRLTVPDGSPAMRLTLDYAGMLNFQSWDSNTSSWAIFSKFPSTACDRYASCGPFGYCDGAEAAPTCKCLDGFEPVDGVDLSRGCRRKKELGCGDDGDGFVTLPGMKTPDKFLYVRNRSFDQCTAECSRDCSCTAYAYATLNNVDATEDRSRCLVWTGELVDTGKFSNGAGENLYLRLLTSQVDTL